MNNITTYKTFFAAALFLAASSAQAVVVEESWNWFDPELGWGEGEFTVTNNSSEDIYAFAVGNDYPADYSPYAYYSNVEWEATVLSSIDWDTGYDMYFNAGPVSTATVGAFDDLFPGFSSVFLYSYLADWSTGPIAIDATEGGFLFGSEQLASPFVAIGAAGNVIDNHDTLHVSAVPLPAAVWLFSLGLGALGLVGRRRRA